MDYEMSICIMFTHKFNREIRIIGGLQEEATF